MKRPTVTTAPWQAAALASLLLLAACGKHEEPAPAKPIATAPPAPPPKPAPVVPTPEGRTTPAITAEDFAARVRKISGDPFEGRKPGTIGERMTTAWIKDQFEQMGLRPGNAGRWIQTVPMVETTLQDPDAVALDVSAKSGAERLAYRTDMVVNALDASHDIVIANSPIDPPGNRSGWTTGSTSSVCSTSRTCTAGVSTFWRGLGRSASTANTISRAMPSAIAIAGNAKASHSAQISPKVQPAPQCVVPLPTMTGKGVSLLCGGSSFRSIAALAFACVARRPYLK